MSDISIAELVDASKDGNEVAFGEIVRRYQSPICAMAYSATGDFHRSEDLAQEAFVTAWRKLTTLEEPSSFASWLRSIARNVILSSFRKASDRAAAHAEGLETAAETVPSDEPTPRDRIISDEERALLWRTLGGLPELYREPLVLFYWEGQSVEAVARALEIPESTVRQRLLRGREHLKDRMADYVEKTLSATRPTEVFTAAVLAALPAAMPHAATAVIAATAAKGTATFKGMSFAGLVGAILGPLVGIAGIIAAFREDVRMGRSSRERKFRLRTVMLYPPWGILFALIIAIVAYFTTPLTQSLPNPMPHFAVIIGFGLLFGLGMGWLCYRKAQRIIQIRREDGTGDFEEPLGSVESYPSRWYAAGALAAAVFVPMCLILVPAWLYGTTASVIVVLVIHAAIYGICFGAAWRDRRRFLQAARLALMCVMATAGWGILIYWERAGGEKVMPMGSAILLAFGLCLLISAALTRRERIIAGK